jgi:ferredoxin
MEQLTKVSNQAGMTCQTGIVLAKLIYFSPTQTTRKVIEGISQGLQIENVERMDLTLPDACATMPPITADIAVIGAPVYGGRLPAMAVSRLRKLKGNGAPAVIVVVYGNRAYEDALLELRDLALEAGFNPIAAGAFIGEHSFSTESAPIAAERPDPEDLGKANAFGRMVLEKMKAGTLNSNPLEVPGNVPYKEVKMLSDVSPVMREASCIRCLKCHSVCPAAAINFSDPALTDKTSCIRCCACVKSCPVGAKAIEDPRIRQVSEKLSIDCAIRKEAEMFL